MKLFHKCSINGLIDLIANHKTFEDSLCCSSYDGSSQLFWRDVCVEIEVDEKDVLASHVTDMDSRGQSRYDEIRVKASKIKIKKIIATGATIKKMKAGNGLAEPLNIPTSKFGHIQNHEKREKETARDFFLNIGIPVVPVAKTKYHKEFLNL